MDRVELWFLLLTSIIILSLILFISFKFTKKNRELRIIIIPAYMMLLMPLIFVFIFYTVTGSYDKLGKRYDMSESITYYAENGSKYTIVEDKNCKEIFVNESDLNDTHDVASGFINKKGYLLFDESGEYKETEKPGIYINSYGNVVYKSSYIDWGWTGLMHRPDELDFINYLVEPWGNRNSYDVSIIIVGIPIIISIIAAAIMSVKKREYETKIMLYWIYPTIYTAVYLAAFWYFVLPLMMVNYIFLFRDAKKTNRFISLKTKIISIVLSIAVPMFVILIHTFFGYHYLFFR